MTNTALLEKKIAESGLKKGYLAKLVGLSPAGFRNCVLNKADFTANQIDILCKALNITAFGEVKAIFFAQVGA